jgi:hypothetical protein
LKTSTSRRILSSSTCISSKKGEQGFPKSSETDDSLDKELDTQNKDSLWSCSKESRAYQQEHDLLGLALITSNDSVPDSRVDSDKEGLEARTQDNISACPIHRSILSNVEALPSQAGELKCMPMERFLAEGLAERYALLSPSYSNTGGEWTRYSACLCGRYN